MSEQTQEGDFEYGADPLIQVCRRTGDWIATEDGNAGCPHSGCDCSPAVYGLRAALDRKDTPPAPDDSQVTVDREDLEWVLGFITNIGPRRGSVLEAYVDRLNAALGKDGE